jgi:hypothetical protein
MTQRAWGAEECEAMQPCVQESPYAAIEGLRSCLGGSHLWDITHGNSRVLLAVRGTTLDNGRLLEVVGMRSLGERMDSAMLARCMDHLARQVYTADLLAMMTRHDHILRGCVRDGWTDVARVAIKTMKVH